MKRLVLCTVASALVASGGIAGAATGDTGPTAPAARHWTGLRAGVAVVDATWHVGAGAGQYASDANPTDVQSEWDPNAQHVKQASSYGVASRLSIRAIVVKSGKGAPVALVKDDNYLAQDMLTRRVGQLLAAAGSRVSYDHILLSATHDHNSPYYSTPAAGVWLFQDVMDLRMFEYQARQMATAIERAERRMVPARVGATTVQSDDFQGNIAGSDVNADGSPTGYPIWENDHGVTVVRFDNMSHPAHPRPLATYVNYAEHGESLDGYDLISADWLAPFQRFVDRGTGAPMVFSQGAVGSAEGPYEYENPKIGRDQGQAFPEIYGHMGYAQAERGTHLLAEKVLRAWRAIGGAHNGVRVQSPFSTHAKVAMLTHWVAGPLSHPYPSVGNCRTGPTAGGDPGVPAAGLPDCARSGDYTGVTLPLSPALADQLKQAGAPLPDNYDVSSFGTVEENLRIKLQAVRIGDTLLASCSCEAQTDLVRNIETRTDRRTGNMWLGFDYGKQSHVDEGWPGMYVRACYRLGSSPYSCPDPRDRWGQSRLRVSAAAFRHMEAEVNNDAAGWADPSYVTKANSEPAALPAIKGNFTHTELGKGSYKRCDGFAVTVGLGHTGDYVGYTVSYREYQARDAYRKALTSYGSHTADYMATNLVAMAARLRCGTPVPALPTDGLAVADEQRQTAEAAALGRLTAAYYDGWTDQVPDSAGPARGIAQPWSIHRFDVTQFRWIGGDNWTDNPTVVVQRFRHGAWHFYGDQSGEVQVFLDQPTDVVTGSTTYHNGAQRWTWRASFEAFDAWPRADVPRGHVSAGTYRFVAQGHIKTGGSAHRYRLESQPFSVMPWRGIHVRSLSRSGHRVIVRVAPITYPRLPKAKHRAGIRWYADDKGGTPKHSLVCKTCSFRPWATHGRVVSLSVVVRLANGSRHRVAAHYDARHDRWVARVPGGRHASVAVPPGGVLDAYGETNRTGVSLSD